MLTLPVAPVPANVVTMPALETLRIFWLKVSLM